MSMKSELFIFLTNNAGVSAIIGDRMFPLQAPSSAVFPYLTWQRIINEHEHHMTAAAGLSKALYQIDSWARSSPGAEALAEAVRLAMDGFRGDMGGVDVRSAHLRDERDDIEAPSDASQESIFRVSQDWSLIHNETIPVFV